MNNQNSTFDIINNIKSFKFNTDSYTKGSYIDAQDETSQWCVGEIIERRNFELNIHFEGWSNKYDIVVDLNKQIGPKSKIASFRKFSKNYTGQKKTAYRIYSFDMKDYTKVYDLIKEYQELDNIEKTKSSYEVIQELRGVIYFYIDIFMTNIYSKPTAEKSIKMINDLLNEYILFSIKYITYYRKYSYLIEYLNKSVDAYLADVRLAILSSINEVIHSLRRIFGSDNRTNEFYRNYDMLLSRILSRSNKQYCKDEFYNLKTTKDGFSVKCLLNYIDFFIDQYGYEKILREIISPNEKNSSFKNLSSMSSSSFVQIDSNKLFSSIQCSQIICENKNFPIQLLSPFISLLLDIKTYQKEEGIDFPEFLFNSILTRIDSLSESELKEVKKIHINMLASQIKGLYLNNNQSNKNMNMNMTRLNSSSKYEEIMIKFYIKNSLSKVLSLRIAGVTSIGNIIFSVLFKKTKEGIREKTEEDFLFETVTDQIMIEYLNQYKLVEYLLNEGIHEEVIRKSTPIFILYIKNDMADNSYLIDLIWRNFVERHESISSQIENMLIDVTIHMNSSQKLYFYEKIKNLSFQLSDCQVKVDKNLNFLQKFIVKCLLSNNQGNEKEKADINSYIISCLYDNIMNLIITNENMPIINKYLNSFNEIFSNDNLQKVLHEECKISYIKKCIFNLKSNQSVYQSFEIIHYVYKSLCKNENQKLIKKCMNQLIKENSIEEIFYNTFKNIISDENNTYREPLLYSFCKVINIAFIDNNTYININSNENIYKFSLSVNVLNEILSHFSISKQDSFIFLNFLLSLDMSIQDNNKELSLFECYSQLILLDYLTYTSTSPINTCLDMDLVDDQVMNKKDILLFQVFKKFFLQVNLMKGYIQKDVLYYRVSSISLLGCEKLIEFLIKSKIDYVQVESANLLFQITYNLVSFTEEFSRKYWNWLLSLVINQLNECIINNDSQGIYGILYYLSLLFKNSEFEGKIPDSDEIYFSKEGKDISFVYEKEGSIRKSRISSDDKVYNIRIRMSYFYDIPYYKCVISSKNTRKVIDSEDDFKLANDVFSSYETYEIHNKNTILNRLKYTPKSILLSQSSLFHSLYELLGKTGKFLELAWELIQLFPLSKQYENLFETCLSYEKILIEDNEYQLNFNLSYIKLYIDSEYTVSNESISGSGFKRRRSSANSLMKQQVLDETSIWKGSINKINQINMNKIINKGCLNLIVLILERISSKININPSSLLYKTISNLIFIINTYSNYIKTSHIQKLSIPNSYSQISFFIIKILSNVVNIRTSSILPRCLDEKEDLFKIVFYFFEKEDFFNRINDEYENLFIDLLWKECVFHMSISIKERIFEFIEKTIEFYIVLGSNSGVFNTGVHIIKEFIRRILLFFEDESYKKTNFISMFENNYDLSIFFKKLSEIIKKYNIFSKKHILKPSINNNQPNNIETVLPKLISYIISSIDIIQCQLNKESEQIDFTIFSYLLSGFISILSSILLSSSSSFILNTINDFKETLYKKVFLSGILSKCKSNPINEPEPVFIINQFSLDSAYELISTLSFNSSLLINLINNDIQSYMNLGFWKGRKYIDWNNTISNDLCNNQSLKGYVGLINLGCICYMNSLFQILNSITSIRESILVIKEKSKDTIKPTESDVLGLSSLSQLKNLFSALKSYDSEAYNPKDFCLNFDGQQLSLSQQMDVDEFFNILLDRLESQIKGSLYDNPFKYEFQGWSSNDIICKTCPHKSEREESYNCLILSVKDNLKKSLEAYIQGEALEGENAFYCELCEKKVDAVKRTSIIGLPRTLIFVLKRFEFNYESLQKYKRNDYCEYPLELNMKRYMKHEIERQENETIINSNDSIYEYSLSGIIVHIGTADSGHYYSIINKDNKWIEFNDSSVKNYDITKLKEDTFGGTTAIKSKEGKDINIEKTSNAYVLLYSRKEREIIKIKGENMKIYENDHIEKMIKEYNDYKFELTSNKQCYLNTYKKDIFNLSFNQLDIVNTYNFQYWVMKIFFNLNYICFIKNLLIQYIKKIDIDHKANISSKNDSHFTNCFISSNTQILNLVFGQYQSQRLLRTRDVIRNSNIDEENLNKNNEKENDNDNDNDYINETFNQETHESIFKIIINTYFNIVIRSNMVINADTINSSSSLNLYFIFYNDIIKILINKYDHNWKFIIREFSKLDVINEFLIDCPINDIKTNVISIIFSALHKAYDDYILNNMDNKHILLIFIETIVYSMIKYSNKDNSFIYFLLYRICQLGNNHSQGNRYIKDYIHKIGFYSLLNEYYIEKSNLYSQNRNEYLYNINTNNNISSFSVFLNNKNSQLTLQLISIENISSNTSNKQSLSSIIMKKSYKLTLSEEINEKKYEKSNLLQVNDKYLYMTYIELLILYSSSSLTNLTSPSFLYMLILQVSTKQASTLFSKYLYLLNSQLQSNSNSTKLLYNTIEAFKLVFSNVDYDKLDFPLRILKQFILINDSFQNKRQKECISMLTDIFSNNQKFYMFSQTVVDWVISIFSFRKNVVVLYDLFKSLIASCLKWVKSNTICPLYVEIKGVSMYKFKNAIYTQSQNNMKSVEDYHKKCEENSNVKLTKLNNIFKKNFNHESIYSYKDYDSDLDLTDFSFSIGDKVRYEGDVYEVVSVLDEAVKVKFIKSLNENEKELIKRERWISTNNQKLELFGLVN